MHRTVQKVCGGVGWVCKPTLVLSFGQDFSWAGKLGQAEQQDLDPLLWNLYGLSWLPRSKING